MMRAGFVLLGLLAVTAAVPRTGVAATNATPSFSEVYQVIQAHLGGTSEAELNRNAVQALVSAFGTKVALITNATGSAAANQGPALSRTNLFDNEIGYIRIKRVDDSLTRSLRDEFARLSGTNELKGLILDLRFAQGSDYAAAAATADLFIGKERPLLNWGGGVIQSKSKSDAITVPVAVLINSRTAAAAEALAAVLRETGSALLLGNRTAGEAMMAQEYPLSDGSRLRIAIAPIDLGDGTAISSQGVKPDISVEVSAQDERAYYTDPFKEIAMNSALAGASAPLTNQVQGTNHNGRRVRFNEAELVRERKEGLNPDADLPAAKESETDQPTIQDPVLARALDVLKGLALVRQTRP